MKFRLFIITVIFLMISGCQIKNNNSQAISEGGVFELKEKCAKYIEPEKERFLAEKTNHMLDPYLEGLFFSNTLKTCVAKWSWMNDGAQQFYIYNDVLTSQQLRSFMPFGLGEDGLIDINISRDNSVVTQEAADYEYTLDLVK